MGTAEMHTAPPASSSRRVQLKSRSLPRPPEAVIPGTPFGLDVLKVVFLLFSLVLVIGLVPGLSSAVRNHLAIAVKHSLLSKLLSLGYAVLFGVGFYGLHRRMRIAWKVGWFYLAFFYLVSIIPAMASTVRLPMPDRWIASGAVVVGFSAVAVYWGRWWNRQKGFFIREEGS